MSLLERLDKITFTNEPHDGYAREKNSNNSKNSGSSSLKINHQTDQENENGLPATAIPAIPATEMMEGDPFRVSGAAIKVFFPVINREVWLCADEKARSLIEGTGLTCLIFSDLEYILQGKPGEDRLGRLKSVCARRNTLTKEILRQFDGEVTSVRTDKENGDE